MHTALVIFRSTNIYVIKLRYVINYKLKVEINYYYVV